MTEREHREENWRRKHNSWNETEKEKGSILGVSFSHVNIVDPVGDEQRTPFEALG
jgi:hypothetical protein